MQYKVVPKSASVEAIDSGVAFALNVTLSNEYRWSDYMRDPYASMVKAAPDTGMVAVRRDILRKMFDLIHSKHFTDDEFDEVFQVLKIDEALGAGV